MTNFFEQQHVAHRKSHVLVVFFAVAVIGVVLAIDAFIAAIDMGITSINAPPPPAPQPEWIDLVRAIPPPLLMWGAGITLAVILIGTFNEVFKLRKGGEASGGL